MAELQSSNRVKLAKVRELTFGVTPNNPVFEAVRRTNAAISAKPKTTLSNEVTDDRQETDLILVGTEAGGDIGGEASFLAIDKDLEEAMQSAFVEKAVRANNGVADSVITAVTASSDTYTVTDAPVDFVPGHLVLASGFGQAGNNLLFRAAATTSGTAIVAPASPGLTDESVPPGTARLKAVGFEGAEDDITATATGLASTLLDFTTLGIQVGEWHYVGGSLIANQFATAMRGRARVSSVTTNALNYDIRPAAWAVDAGTGKKIQVFFGDFMKNDSTKVGNTFERQYLDHSPVTYEYIRGCTINQMAINIQQQAIATYTKTYIGKDGEVLGSRLAGASDVPAPTYEVYNTSTNVGGVVIDGSIVTGPNFLMNTSLTINNNLREQQAVGAIGAVGLGNGAFNVTMTHNFYFGNRSIYEKVLNNQATSIAFPLGYNKDNREGYMFDCPRVKYASGAPDDGGKNTDVMLQTNVQAIKHPTLGYTMSVTRFWYLPAP